MMDQREATLDDLLSEPIIRKVMASDGVRASYIRRLMRQAKVRKTHAQNDPWNGRKRLRTDLIWFRPDITNWPSWVRADHSCTPRHHGRPCSVWIPDNGSGRLRPLSARGSR